MLVIFTHEITVDRPRAARGAEGLGLSDFVTIELTVTAQGSVRHGPEYDTPFGPLNFQTTVEDLEITSCVNESGTEVFSKLDIEDSQEIMREAEKQLEREYDRDLAGAD